MADGTIKIDIDIPVNKVKSDTQEINHMVENIGKNAGKDMDSSFKKNAESVKHEAKSTGEAIDKDIGKEHKTKIKVDGSEAKTKANEAKCELDKMPKEHKTKLDADNSEFNRKANEAKRKTNELPKKHNTDIDATDKTGGVFARIKSHFEQVNEEGKKTHSLFGTIFSANVISNAAMSAFGHVKDALGGMVGEAKQYALEQQTMNATWLTLTNSASKGRAMVNQINQMAVAAQNSTKMVDELSQKFYAINNNAKQTGQLTKSILTLQDAFGQTDAAVENFGTQFSQMMANGKVSAQDMMSIVNTFPKLRPMLLDYERRIHHSSNMTMAEMNKMMSAGKIKSQDMINVVLEAGKKFNKATGNFTKTIPGMTRVVQSQMPVLLGAFTKPLAKMESPVYSAIANWVSSKKTNKEFQALGKTVSTGMNNVMKAFSGGKAVNVTKALDSAINGINKGLKGVFGWISGHAKDLKTIASSIASIGGQIAKAVWKDFASIITTIGNMFGLTAKHGKASSSAIHVIAEALNSLAKNKTAIKAISDAIVAIAVVKGLDRVGGGLFSIGEKGYGAYRKIKFLVKGMQGIKDIKGLSNAEKGFLKFGNGIRKAGRISKNVFGAIRKLGKGAWNGIKFATKSFVKSFTNQLKIIGRSIKGLGSIAWNAAKSVGSKFLNAGKFLGSKLSQGIKATMKFGMGKRLATGALAGAAVATPEVINAVKDRHNANKRSQDIGGAVGAVAGGTLTSMIPVVGPMLAPVGAIIGKYAGRWGGQAVNNFTKGWQKNKPPKKFWSLENLGWSTRDTFRKVGKWGSDVGKKFGQGLRKGKSFAKKNSKELALTAVSPLLGIPALLYKNNPKFRKWANGVGKNIKSGLSKAGKAVNHFKSSLSKNFKKAWDNVYKHSSKGTKQIMRSVSRFAKSYIKTNSKANKETIKNFASFSKRLKKNHGDLFKTIGQTAKKQLAIEKKRWSSNWKNIRSTAQGIWKGLNHNASDMYKKLNTATHGGLSKVLSGFKSFGKGIKDFWNGLWKGITKTFDDTVKNLQDAANNVGKFFTGKLKVGSLHLAGGTDWRKRWATPAILNDGTDSPQTHNRESIIHANGAWELLPDRANLKRFLLPGDEVVNARDTAKLFGKAVHLAGGSLPYGISLPSVNYSQVEEKALKRLQHINEEQLQLAKKEARRKQARDNKKDRQKKSNSKKKSKANNFSSDTKRVKGSVLVDKGLLYDSRKDVGKNTYVNEKLFKRLMSYTKAKPIKVSKNSRIRYRDLPTRRQGKYYLVDSKWLTGAKNNTGKLEKLDRESYLKLLQFTKAERKYKLPKKKRKTTRKRTTTRRTTTRRSTASRVHSAVSTGGYSVGRVSSAISSVSASVKGLGSVKALSKALKGIKGKHKVSVTAKASGSKSITKLAKSIKKVTGKHKVTIKTKGLSSLKSLYKAAKKIKGSTHKVRVKTSGTSSLKKLRSAISKVADESKKATKDIKGKGNFAKAFESLTKTTDKTLSKLRSNAEKDFKSMWSNLKKATSSGVSKINHDTSSFNSKFTRQWRSLTSGAEKIFNKFWSTMKSSARSGLNDVIGVLNSAIGKIDTVVGQFGGSKNAVHKVARLATGTGALGGIRRPITAPTLAILNDGNDSPETGNQEAIWDRNTGNVEVVPGRFTPRILKPGQEVFNATETAMLGYTTPQHFATGTGALKELYHIAKNNWEHPQKTGQALFSSINGLTGAINQLAQGAKDKGEDQGVKWWSQLWKMVDDKVNSDDLGPASGLLKAVEELGHGKRYLWGGYGLDSKGLDCSGLVSTALEHYFHSGWGHLDVAGLWQHAHRIPKSEAKPGDPVFWLPDEHVGVYAGHNLYYSAYGPNDGGPIGMQPVGSGATFGRFEGIKTDGAKNAKEAVKVKANNKLQKQIKKQVGPGFWKTIQKIADKFGEQFNGANSITGSMIEAAARKMHVNLPDGFVKDVLRVAMSESGNRNIQQRIIDMNSGGNEAQGPLQFTPQTFKIFAMPGHTNIHNPYDELLAFFNNSDWRHSIGWTVIRGTRKFDWLGSGPKGHRRFGHGGILTHPETIDVAEAGHPESVIPWDPAQRAKAYALMQATLDGFKAQDGNALQYQNQAQQVVDLTKTNAEIQAINDKFDEALAALGILTSQNDVIQVNNYLDKNKIGEAVFSVMKRLNMRSTRNSRYNISGH
ncbi:tape measure protein [Lactobacillus crispatus]|uniref:tape measure protein n=1 Tax=Lactobacillus crispatus TaxID=47770 RepID=UPI0018E3689F|nr:tape measure protein [Lactobacillus crispatus]MBI1722233.1 tape measure protein [Lactobacillus crispatus]